MSRETDSHRIGPPQIAVLGCTALLLVSIGGVVAATPSAEQPVEHGIESHDAAVADGSAAIQEESNDTEESAAIVNPTPDDEPYEVGETVPIQLSLGGSEVLTVTLSANDSEQNARFTATVRANDSTGNATVRFDTDAFAGENDGFSVADENVELVNTSSEYSEQLAEALRTDTYDIILAEGDQPHYEAGVNATDRSALELINPVATIRSPTAGDSIEGGEPVTIDLALQDTDVGTVSITYVGGDASYIATVSDDDGDGNATVMFDPTAVSGENSSFSAGDGSSLVERSADGSEDPSVPSLYDITVSPSEDAPGSGGAVGTDSLELVVTGGGEAGDENGQENGMENGDENGQENGMENGDENGQENGMENGDDEGGAMEDGNETSDDGGESSDDGDGAGFGVIAAVGAVVAAVLVARAANRE